MGDDRGDHRPSGAVAVLPAPHGHANGHGPAPWWNRPGTHAADPRGSRHATLAVQLFVFAAFVLPTDTVLKVVGAQGYVASLVAMLMFCAWLLTALFGFHDPLHTRYPVRGALALLWTASLLSYAAMPFYGPDATQRLGAGRWLMLWVGMAGVILVTAELMKTPWGVVRVVRTVVWGASFSGFVAILQFWVGFDVNPLLRKLLVGFSYNASFTGFQSRDALVRVSGTAGHPIELGVVSGMVLPLAIWLAMYDANRRPLVRWGPLALIGMAIPLSVSRSAILALALSMGVFVLLLPARQRVWILGALPLGLVAVFATTPGYLRTITKQFGMGTSDPSITNRLNNYPRVLASLRGAPWFGRGGGTDIQVDLTKVLDNQYLHSVIELGGVGVAALVLYFLVPVVAALVVRTNSTEPHFRALCAALAGATLAAAASSYTFDSFSFAQFAALDAVAVGLVGACWLGVHRWPRGLAPDRVPRRPATAPPLRPPAPQTREAST